MEFLFNKTKKGYVANLLTIVKRFLELFLFPRFRRAFADSDWPWLPIARVAIGGILLYFFFSIIS